MTAEPMAAVAEDVLDEEEMVARMLAVGGGAAAGP